MSRILTFILSAALVPVAVQARASVVGSHSQCGSDRGVFLEQKAHGQEISVRAYQLLPASKTRTAEPAAQTAGSAVGGSCPDARKEPVASKPEVRATRFATAFAEPGPAAGASSWKTYRSEKFGFEVRYPPDLRSEIPQNSSSSVGFIDREFQGTDCYEFQVEVEPRKAMSTEEAIQKSGLFYTKKQAQSYYHDNPGLGAFPFATAPEDAYFVGGGMMDPGLHRVEETRVNGYFALAGKTWTRCYYNAGGIAGSGAEKVVFLLGKESYASIEIFWENADTDKMLSSFKFIGPAGSAAFRPFEVPRLFSDSDRAASAPDLCRGSFATRSAVRRR